MTSSPVGRPSCSTSWPRIEISPRSWPLLTSASRAFVMRLRSTWRSWPGSARSDSSAGIAVVTVIADGTPGAKMRSSSSTTAAGDIRVVPAPARPENARSWCVSSAARRPASRMFSTAARPGIAARQIAEREVGVADHGDEQVVEVVREPAGEHAEALCALGVDEAALECARCGDIERRADRADDRAVLAIRRDRDRELLAAIRRCRNSARLAVERALVIRDRIDGARLEAVDATRAAR